jgi:MoxR-like ATPase
MNDLQTRFHDLESDLNTVLFERSAEIHSSLLALIAKRHLFMVGAPGIAKSMLVDQLTARISGLEGENYFKTLLAKFTVPEELFGPPDFTLMKDSGIYKRVTTNKLPRAKIGFLDEAFKANSAILNSLLTILNEGLFFNHDDDPHVPLQSLFAASNEIPTSGDLEALADRLHFWHYVEHIHDPSNFAKMLLMAEETEPTQHISMDDIVQAREEMRSVVIGDDIVEMLVDLSNNLRGLGIFVSDRRFRQSVDIIKAEAWLQGRTAAEVLDTKPLVHVMWRDVPQIPIVRKAVLDLADPIERDILNLRDEIEKVYVDFIRTVEDSDSNTIKAQHAIEAYQKFTKAKDEWKELRDRQAATGRESVALESLRQRLKDIGPELLERGLQFRSDTKALGDLDN